MPNSNDSRLSVSQAWEDFASRHSGNPFLEMDALYSLPLDLIEAIRDTIPGFFTRAQLDFERDLTNTVSFGFFLKQPIGLIDPIRQNQMDLRIEESSKNIDEMLKKELIMEGHNENKIIKHLKKDSKTREKIGDIKKSYLGWLILNPNFQSELRQLRLDWEEKIRLNEGFPRLPNRYFPDSNESLEPPTDFEEACFEFYFGWGLETLLTWDWPVPMEPDLNLYLRPHHPLKSSGGVSLYIPWYLMREKNLDFQELIREFGEFHSPSHLGNWVSKRFDKKNDRLGEKRFAETAFIYKNFHLALLKRYEEQCGNSFTAIDNIIASLLGYKIRKIKGYRNESIRKKRILITTKIIESKKIIEPSKNIEAKSDVEL